VHSPLISKEVTSKELISKETPVNVENQGLQPSESPDRKIQNTTKNEVATITKEVQKRVNTKKPQVWHDFFEAYPPNKKGGNDHYAWKTFKAENLTEHDLEDMLFDVRERAKMDSTWVEKYATGITKYIKEAGWKRPRSHGGKVTAERIMNETDPEILEWCNEIAASQLAGD
jgi:hypothetical protein